MYKKPFFEKKKQELRLEIEAALLLLDKAKTFTNKNGYVCVIRKENKELFKAMEDLQFFEFQSSNKTKQIAGVHQFVLYLHRGVWTWRYFKYKLEAADKEGTRRTDIHHLNSVVSDNRPENLVYVTPQQNSFCADAVCRPYHGLRALNSANVKTWAKYNGASDTAKLIRLTMIRTFEAMGFTLEQMPTVANILLQLPINVGKEVIKQWRFSWQAELESKMQSLNGSAA